MGCTLFWVKVGHAFAYFVVSVNFLFDCKTRQFLEGKRKYIFVQESFYLLGILVDTNEQDTSFLDCKPKHMMKSGAPPDKFRVPYRMVTYISWFHKQN